jgi:hypothetical protein
VSGGTHPVEIRASADQRAAAAAGSAPGITLRLYGEDVRHLGRHRSVRLHTRKGYRVP